MKELENIKQYYDSKLDQHGAVPQGVDWNSSESQELRYDQLLKCVEINEGIENRTLLDYGCGYGGLLEYLNKIEMPAKYIGYDISDKMLEAAKEKFKNHQSVQWLNSLDNSKFDFVVASGIFNVRLESDDNSWYAQIQETLRRINDITINSFAFNILTSYSDRDKMRDYLYYAEPEKLFKFCKENFSKQVALYHDYGLYEFTIVVRKENNS